MELFKRPDLSKGLGLGLLLRSLDLVMVGLGDVVSILRRGRIGSTEVASYNQIKSSGGYYLFVYDVYSTRRLCTSVQSSAPQG